MGEWITPAIYIAAYLLGSIPFGLLLTRAAGLGDIRTTGSGNIGATNVLRTGNKKIAVTTLFLDMLKGTLAVLVALLCFPPDFNHEGHPIPPYIAYIAAFMALIGHIFPIWLHGKGGKGVATYFGVLLAISPITFAIAASNWIALFYVRRISSLAALFAAAFSPIWLFIFTNLTGMTFGIIAGGLIFYTHRANIERLLNGTEPRFGASKDTHKQEGT